MGQNDVNIGINAQGSSARAQFMAVVQSINRMEESLRRVSHSSARTAKNTRQQLTGVRKTAATAATSMRNLLGVGSGGAALLTVTQMLRSEMQAIVQLQGQMKTQEVGTGQAIARLHAQLPPDSDIKPSELKEMALQSKSGLPVGEIIDLMTSGMSAGEGASDVRGRLQGVVNATPLIQAFPQEERTKMMEGAIAVRDAFGGSIEGRTAQLLGALSASPSASEVGPFMQNMTGTVAAMKGLGYTFKESLARFLTFQQTTRDTTGATARTGALKVAGQLEEKFVSHGITKEEVAPGQRLEFIQTSEDPRAAKIRTEMLGIFDRALNEAQRQKLAAQPGSAAQGEAENRIKNLMAEREMLQRRSEVDMTDQTHPQVRLLENLNENVPSMGRAVELAEQRQHELMQDPAMAAYKLSLEMNRMNRATRADPAGAARAQLREVIEKEAKALGDTALASRMKSFASTVSSMDAGVDEVYGQLNEFLKHERGQLDQAIDLRADVVSSFGGGPIGGVQNAVQRLGQYLDVAPYEGYGMRPKGPDEFSARDTRLAQALDDMIARVEAMQKAQAEAANAPAPPLEQTGPAALLRPITDNRDDLSNATRNLWRAAEGFPQGEISSAEKAGETFRSVAERALEGAMTRPLTEGDERKLDEATAVVERQFRPDRSFREMLTAAGMSIDGGQRQSPLELPRQEQRYDQKTVDEFNRRMSPAKEAPKQTTIPLRPGVPEQAAPEKPAEPKPGDSAAANKPDNSDVVAMLQETNALLRQALVGRQEGMPVMPPRLGPARGDWESAPMRPGYDPPPINIG